MKPLPVNLYTCEMASRLLQRALTQSSNACKRSLQKTGNEMNDSRYRSRIRLTEIIFDSLGLGESVPPINGNGNDQVPMTN